MNKTEQKIVEEIESGLYSKFKKILPYILTVLLTGGGVSGGVAVYGKEKATSGYESAYDVDSAIIATNVRIDKVEDKLNNVETNLSDIKVDVRESRTDIKQILFLMKK